MVTTHQHTKQTARVAVLRTKTQVDVSHRTTVHASTQTEVDNRLLVTIVYTGDTGQVTLLIVGTDTLYNVRRQVLQGCLSIAELLTVHFDFRYRLTVNLDVTIVVKLSTRQALHQFLDNRTLGRAEGVCIINQGIALRLDLGQVGCHRSPLQHDGIGKSRWYPWPQACPD